MTLRTKSIPLDPPLDLAGQPVTEIVLREPPFDSIIQNGEPWFISRTPDGLPVYVDNPDAISAYLDVCLVNVPRYALADAGTRVALAVRDALVAFFLPDRAEDAGSTTSPTT